MSYSFTGRSTHCWQKRGAGNFMRNRRLVQTVLLDVGLLQVAIAASKAFWSRALAAKMDTGQFIEGGLGARLVFCAQ